MFQWQFLHLLSADKKLILIKIKNTITTVQEVRNTFLSLTTFPLKSK